MHPHLESDAGEGSPGDLEEERRHPRRHVVLQVGHYQMKRAQSRIQREVDEFIQRWTYPQIVSELDRYKVTSCSQLAIAGSWSNLQPILRSRSEGPRDFRKEPTVFASDASTQSNATL